MLRRFRAEDLAAFVAYRSDPEIARYQSWEAPYPSGLAEILHGAAGQHPTRPASGSSSPWRCAAPIG